jgi:hypothetical protein
MSLPTYSVSEPYRSEGNWWACDVLRTVPGDKPRKMVTVFALDQKRAAVNAQRLVSMEEDKP